MATKLENMLEAKLSEIIVMLNTMRQDYKSEIESIGEVEMDVDAGIVSLEDALYSWKKAHDEKEEDEGDGSDSYEKHCATEGNMKNFI